MSKLVCTKCGKEANEGELFCKECGSKLMYVLDEKDEVTSKKEKSKKEEKKEEKVIEEIATEPEKVEVKEEIEEVVSEPIVEEIKEKPKKQNRVVAVTADGREVVDYVQYKPKKKKTGLVVSIIIILLLLIIIGVLVFFIMNKDSENKKEEDKPIEDKDKDKDKDKEKEKEENYKYIKVYCDYYNNFNTTASGRYITDIPVVNDDYDVLAGVIFYDSSYNEDGGIVLYRDGDKVHIYNSDTKKKDTINLNASYEKYSIVTDLKNRKAYGIEFQEGIEKEKDKYGYETVKRISKSGYYNLNTEKELYNYLEYHDFNYVTDDKISAVKGYEKDSEATAYLLNSKKEEQLLSKTYEQDGCEEYKYKGYGDFVLAGESYCMDDGVGNATLYDKDLNVLKTGIYESNISYYNNELFYNDETSITKYNKNGLEIYKKEFTKVLDVIRGFFIIVKDNQIVITNEDNIEVILGEWKDTYFYHSMISGYYNANQLDNEQEKDAGIYLIIETGENGPSSGVEYYFNVDTHNTKKFDLPEIGGYAKPVLYLYPEEETNVTVTFENKNNITVSYPKFKNSWEVVAKPNGDLYDKDGKYYYGLYWEEELNHKVDFTEGFYVEKENAIEFLEEKLESIGLNNKERNEFIMYWLPILERNEKNLVYFELTEERDNFNKLIINPVPDSILRLAIHVKKVNEKVNIKEEILPTFERVGFTAVEWGGVLYK